MSENITITDELVDNNLFSDPIFSQQCYELMQKYRTLVTQFKNKCICEQNIENECNFNVLEKEVQTLLEKQPINPIIIKKPVKSSIKVEELNVEEEISNNVDDYKPELDEDFEDNQLSGDDGSDEEFTPEVPKRRSIKRKYNKRSDNSEPKIRKKYVYYNFVCDWLGCGRKYSKKDDLLAHISSCHTKEKPFKCEICWKCFSIEKFLKNHQKNYHSATKHKSDSNPIKSFVCEIKDCGKTFYSSSNLKKHQTTVHSNEKPYVCEWPGCCAAYKIKESLINHRAVHSDERQFKCDIEGCLKTFQTKWNLYSHMKTHRSKANPERARKYPCDWPGCQFNGKNKQDLTIHMNRHMNIKPYKCQTPDCPMSYFTSYELKQHIIKVHEVVNESDREFKCHVEGCQKRYATERDLKRHHRRHDRIYVCSWPECGQRYAAKQLLSDHMDRHMNVKSFHCHVVGCGKSFFSKTNYEGHMKKIHKYNSNKNKPIDQTLDNI